MTFIIHLEVWIEAEVLLKFVNRTVQLQRLCVVRVKGDNDNYIYTLVSSKGLNITKGDSDQEQGLQDGKRKLFLKMLVNL